MAFFAVFPEAIPEPNVPIPEQSVALISATARIISSPESGCTRNKIKNEVINEKIMGVSIIASLSNVKERILLYNFLLTEMALSAFFAHSASPMVGPIQPSPIAIPTARSRTPSKSLCRAGIWSVMNVDTSNAEISGVCISACVIIIKLTIFWLINGCRAIEVQAVVIGNPETMPRTPQVMLIAIQMPVSAIADLSKIAPDGVQPMSKMAIKRPKIAEPSISAAPRMCARKISDRAPGCRSIAFNAERVARHSPMLTENELTATMHDTDP